MYTIYMPRLGANIDKVTVLTWKVKEGDDVKKGDIVALLETDKSSFDLESEDNGIVKFIFVKEGQEVPYNYPLLIIGDIEENVSKEIEKLKKTKYINEAMEFQKKIDANIFDDNKVKNKNKILLSPGVKKIIEENKISEDQLPFIFKDSKRPFLSEDDVLNWLKLPKGIIYGASNSAKQILEIINNSNEKYKVNFMIDNNTNIHNKKIRGLKTLGGFEYFEKIKNEKICIFVSSHSNKRKIIFEKIKSNYKNFIYPKLIDKSCIIQSDAKIGNGTLIEAGCLIGHEANIGFGCILNLGAKMSHNVSVGEYSHLAIGVSLSGLVRIGSNCLIGAGASANPSIKIGNNCIVTPGSAVTTNIPNDVVVSGNPAKIIGKSKRNL